MFLSIFCTIIFELQSNIHMYQCYLSYMLYLANIVCFDMD